MGLLESIWDTKLLYYNYMSNTKLVELVKLDQLTLNPMLSYTAVQSPVCPGCVQTYTLFQC